MSISMRKGSIIASGFVHDGEPEVKDVMTQRRPSNYEAVRASGKGKTQENTTLTGASALTLKQSLVPLILVTTLFFVSRLYPSLTFDLLLIMHRCGVLLMVFLTH